MLNTEIWKTIEGFDYDISNKGRFRNRSGKIIKPFLINSGYYCVRVSNGKLKKGFLVHRLVAKSFCEGYFEGAVVSHKDHNKHNNDSSNLEWCTQKDNMAASREAGRMPYNKPPLGIKLKPRGKSGVTSNYFGVYWLPRRGCWYSSLHKDGRSLGRKEFGTEIEAARHWDYLVETYDPIRRKNFS